jgi:hypothetical protein
VTAVTTQAARNRPRVRLYRLDVRRGGGPFVPESFHETFDAAYDRGLSCIGVSDGQWPAPGVDFIVREP